MDAPKPDQPTTPRHPLEDRDVAELRVALGADFEVIRPLGQGSVASVFLARDRALGVLVAIKVLHPDKASDETARRRFEREARAAASLADNPHTVAVTRFGRLPDGTPWLVMQYVKGRTMAERLQAEGELPVEEATQTLAEVASALETAHAKGIVHRDVRPGNVLWDEERSVCRLTDFGIAAVVSHTGPETTRLTKTGQLLGDPRYLSPEQLLDQDLTELADIYMFGVMGYEIFSGRGPYDARSPTEWITAHINREPRDLRELRPDAPAHVADLLRRCLAKKPNHRPSARDVVRILGGGEAAPGDAAPARQQEAADLQTLINKRVPQIVLITAGAGVTLIGLSDALEELLPPEAKLLTVVFVVAAVVASAVVAWFHGERGRQRAPAIEYVLLGLIAAGWLAVSVMVVLG
ncbi:MAG: hypothetical protein AMXMBFR53_24600 [Gemmatimonadota bacterium]